MILLFLFFFLHLNVRQGTSVPLGIHRREDPTPETFRTTFAIIWSCFVTIFACVWTSAHPNIPAPRDSGWTRWKRLVIMMVYALIAPEMIVFWAWRQYEAAVWIAEDYNDEFIPSSRANASSAKRAMFQRAYKWTVNSMSNTIQSTKQWWNILPERAAWRTQEMPWSQSHGFFVQMGGFVLYEKGVPIQVLDYPRFKKLLKLEAIDAPLIAESDIQDRSKGDAISKGFVVLQTTWFIVQCITRVTKDLPLCELEIVTLGFAVLNAIIYAVCWNKPQGVHACICIPLLKDSNSMGCIIRDLIDMMPNPVAGDTYPGMAPVEPQAPPSHGFALYLQETQSRLGSTKQDHRKLLDSFRPENTSGLNLKGAFGWLRAQLHKDYRCLPIWQFVFFFFLRCIQFILRPLAKMADSDTVEAGALRVPMFYAYSGSDLNASPQSGEIASSPGVRQRIFRSFNILSQAIDQTQAQIALQSQAYLASCVIGVVFGAVHLLAWSATFATAIERNLWRVSAIIITVVPAIAVIGWPSFLLLGVIRKQDFVMKIPFMAKAARLLQVGIPAALGVPFYVLARLTLLTLALISLRNLPPGVHTDVSWPSFIPHF